MDNLSSAQEIKLEDCKILNEFSVIILYKNSSDVIICQNSEDANTLYKYLSDRLADYKSKSIALNFQTS